MHTSVLKDINPLPLNILRFRAETKPKIKGKQQELPNWNPLEGNRVKPSAFPVSKFLKTATGPYHIALRKRKDDYVGQEPVRSIVIYTWT